MIVIAGEVIEKELGSSRENGICVSQHDPKRFKHSDCKGRRVIPLSPANANQCGINSDADDRDRNIKETCSLHTKVKVHSFKQYLTKNLTTERPKSQSDFQNTVTCELCGITLSRRSSLIRHKANFHADKLHHNKCHDCNLVFSRKQTLQKHIAEFHSVINDSETPDFRSIDGNISRLNPQLPASNHNSSENADYSQGRNNNNNNSLSENPLNAGSCVVNKDQNSSSIVECQSNHEVRVLEHSGPSDVDFRNNQRCYDTNSSKSLSNGMSTALKNSSYSVEAPYASSVAGTYAHHFSFFREFRVQSVMGMKYRAIPIFRKAPKQNFKCPVCFLELARKWTLDRHMQTLHPHYKEESNNENVNTGSSLEDTIEYMHCCPLCDNSFKRKWTLKRHIISAHKNKESCQISHSMEEDALPRHNKQNEHYEDNEDMKRKETGETEHPLGSHSYNGHCSPEFMSQHPEYILMSAKSSLHETQGPCNIREQCLQSEITETMNHAHGNIETNPCTSTVVNVYSSEDDSCENSYSISARPINQNMKDLGNILHVTESSKDAIQITFPKKSKELTENICYHCGAMFSRKWTLKRHVETLHKAAESSQNVEANLSCYEIEATKNLLGKECSTLQLWNVSQTEGQQRSQGSLHVEHVEKDGATMPTDKSYSDSETSDSHQRVADRSELKATDPLNTESSCSHSNMTFSAPWVLKQHLIALHVSEDAPHFTRTSFDRTLEENSEMNHSSDASNNTGSQPASSELCMSPEVQQTRRMSSLTCNDRVNCSTISHNHCDPAPGGNRSTQSQYPTVIVVDEEPSDSCSRSLDSSPYSLETNRIGTDFTYSHLEQNGSAVDTENVCSLCEQHFCRRWTLKRHLVTVHGVDEPQTRTFSHESEHRNQEGDENRAFAINSEQYSNELDKVQVTANKLRPNDTKSRSSACVSDSQKDERYLDAITAHSDQHNATNDSQTTASTSNIEPGALNSKSEKCADLDCHNESRSLQQHHQGGLACLDLKALHTSSEGNEHSLSRENGDPSSMSNHSNVSVKNSPVTLHGLVETENMQEDGKSFLDRDAVEVVTEDKATDSPPPTYDEHEDIITGTDEAPVAANDFNLIDRRDPRKVSRYDDSCSSLKSTNKRDTEYQRTTSVKKGCNSEFIHLGMFGNQQSVMLAEQKISGVLPPSFIKVVDSSYTNLSFRQLKRQTDNVTFEQSSSSFEVEHICSLCERSFSRRWTLKRHLITVHGLSDIETDSFTSSTNLHREQGDSSKPTDHNNMQHTRTNDQFLKAYVTEVDVLPKDQVPDCNSKSEDNSILDHHKENGIVNQLKSVTCGAPDLQKNDRDIVIVSTHEGSSPSKFSLQYLEGKHQIRNCINGENFISTKSNLSDYQRSGESQEASKSNCFNSKSNQSSEWKDQRTYSMNRVHVNSYPTVVYTSVPHQHIQPSLQYPFHSSSLEATSKKVFHSSSEESIKPPEMEHLCSVCNNSFTRKWSLKRHLVSVHGLSEAELDSFINDMTQPRQDDGDSSVNHGNSDQHKSRDNMDSMAQLDWETEVSKMDKLTEIHTVTHEIESDGCGTYIYQKKDTDPNITKSCNSDEEKGEVSKVVVDCLTNAERHKAINMVNNGRFINSDTPFAGTLPLYHPYHPDRSRYHRVVPSRMNPADTTFAHANFESKGKPEFEYFCNMCGYTFSRKWSLKRHLVTLHEMSEMEADSFIGDMTQPKQDECNNRAPLDIQERVYRPNISRSLDLPPWEKSEDKPRGSEKANVTAHYYEDDNSDRFCNSSRGKCVNDLNSFNSITCEDRNGSEDYVVRSELESKCEKGSETEHVCSTCNRHFSHRCLLQKHLVAVHGLTETELKLDQSVNDMCQSKLYDSANKLSDESNEQPQSKDTSARLCSSSEEDIKKLSESHKLDNCNIPVDDRMDQGYKTLALEADTQKKSEDEAVEKEYQRTDNISRGRFIDKFHHSDNETLSPHLPIQLAEPNTKELPDLSSMRTTEVRFNDPPFEEEETLQRNEHLSSSYCCRLSGKLSQKRHLSTNQAICESDFRNIMKKRSDPSYNTDLENTRMDAGMRAKSVEFSSAVKDLGGSSSDTSEDHRKDTARCKTQDTEKDNKPVNMKARSLDNSCEKSYLDTLGPSQHYQLVPQNGIVTSNLSATVNPFIKVMHLPFQETNKSTEPENLCTICSQSFSRRWSLKRHMSTVHKSAGGERDVHIDDVNKAKKADDCNKLPEETHEQAVRTFASMSSAHWNCEKEVHDVKNVHGFETSGDNTESVISESHKQNFDNGNKHQSSKYESDTSKTTKDQNSEENCLLIDSKNRKSSDDSSERPHVSDTERQGMKITGSSLKEKVNSSEGKHFCTLCDQPFSHKCKLIGHLSQVHGISEIELSYDLDEASQHKQHTDSTTEYTENSLVWHGKDKENLNNACVVGSSLVSSNENPPDNLKNNDKSLLASVCEINSFSGPRVMLPEKNSDVWAERHGTESSHSLRGIAWNAETKCSSSEQTGNSDSLGHLCGLCDHHFSRKWTLKRHLIGIHKLTDSEADSVIHDTNTRNKADDDRELADLRMPQCAKIDLFDRKEPLAGRNVSHRGIGAGNYLDSGGSDNLVFSSLQEHAGNTDSSNSNLTLSCTAKVEIFKNERDSHRVLGHNQIDCEKQWAFNQIPYSSRDIALTTIEQRNTDLCQIKMEPLSVDLLTNYSNSNEQERINCDQTMQLNKFQGEFNLIQDISQQEVTNQHSNSSDAEYTCSMCNGCFSRKWTLKRHLLGVHGLSEAAIESILAESNSLKQNASYDKVIAPLSEPNAGNVNESLFFSKITSVDRLISGMSNMNTEINNIAVNMNSKIMMDSDFPGSKTREFQRNSVDPGKQSVFLINNENAAAESNVSEGTNLDKVKGRLDRVVYTDDRSGPGYPITHTSVNKEYSEDRKSEEEGHDESCPNGNYPGQFSQLSCECTSLSCKLKDSTAEALSRPFLSYGDNLHEKGIPSDTPRISLPGTEGMYAVNESISYSKFLISSITESALPSHLISSSLGETFAPPASANSQVVKPHLLVDGTAIDVSTAAVSLESNKPQTRSEVCELRQVNNFTHISVSDEHPTEKTLEQNTWSTSDIAVDENIGSKTQTNLSHLQSTCDRTKTAERNGRHLMKKCPMCEVTFARKWTLQRHIWKVHQKLKVKKRLKMTKQGRDNKVRSTGITTTQSHDQRNQRTCKFCNIKFTQKQMLERHKARFHNNESFHSEEDPHFTNLKEVAPFKNINEGSFSLSTASNQEALSQSSDMTFQGVSSHEKQTTVSSRLLDQSYKEVCMPYTAPPAAKVSKNSSQSYKTAFPAADPDKSFHDNLSENLSQSLHSQSVRQQFLECDKNNLDIAVITVDQKAQTPPNVLKKSSSFSQPRNKSLTCDATNTVEKKGTRRRKKKKHIPGKCDFCGVVFARRWTLVRHIAKAHSKVKKRNKKNKSALIPSECTKTRALSFKRAVYMKRTCRFCNLTFTQRAMLEKHLESVHYNEEYPVKRTEQYMHSNGRTFNAMQDYLNLTAGCHSTSITGVAGEMDSSNSHDRNSSSHSTLWHNSPFTNKASSEGLSGENGCVPNHVSIAMSSFPNVIPLTSNFQKPSERSKANSEVSIVSKNVSISFNSDNLSHGMPQITKDDSYSKNNPSCATDSVEDSIFCPVSTEIKRSFSDSFSRGQLSVAYNVLEKCQKPSLNDASRIPYSDIGANDLAESNGKMNDTSLQHVSSGDKRFDLYSSKNASSIPFGNSYVMRQATTTMQNSYSESTNLDRSRHHEFRTSFVDRTPVKKYQEHLNKGLRYCRTNKTVGSHRNPANRCPFCGFIFTRRWTLMRHIGKVHIRNKTRQRQSKTEKLTELPAATDQTVSNSETNLDTGYSKAIDHCDRSVNLQSDYLSDNEQTDKIVTYSIDNSVTDYYRIQSEPEASTGRYIRKSPKTDMKLEHSNKLQTCQDSCEDQDVSQRETRPSHSITDNYSTFLGFKSPTNYGDKMTSVADNKRDYFKCLSKASRQSKCRSSLDNSYSELDNLVTMVNVPYSYERRRTSPSKMIVEPHSQETHVSINTLSDSDLPKIFQGETTKLQQDNEGDYRSRQADLMIHPEKTQTLKEGDCPIKQRKKVSNSNICSHCGSAFSRKWTLDRHVATIHSR